MNECERLFRPFLSHSQHLIDKSFGLGVAGVFHSWKTLDEERGVGNAMAMGWEAVFEVMVG